MMFTQDHVFSNGEILDHPIAHPFFGDIGKHAVSDLARGKRGDVPAFKEDFTAGGFSQAGDGLRQFALTVAGDTRDLPGFHQLVLQD